MTLTNYSFLDKLKPILINEEIENLMKYRYYIVSNYFPQNIKYLQTDKILY
jgi:hypothetical protein